MATRFQLKRSSVGGVVPTTGDIAVAELAVNVTDRKLYTSDGTAVFQLGSGSVTQVSTGNGLTGGPITTTGTVSVLANSGIIANSSGTFVFANTGLVANATGLHVNSTYINTISSNSATYANASISNTFTVGTSGYFVSNGNLGLGNTAPSTKLQISGNYGVVEVVIASTNNININCASGNYFYATANGSATTITFSSVPANTGYGFILILANGGSNTVTWSSSPKWPSATAPTVSSNTDVFTFITDDGGTTWRGVQSMKDVR
jgi:hypothetical protein